MALTAALAMTLSTAPAEQPGYAGHFIIGFDLFFYAFRDWVQVDHWSSWKW